MKKLPILLALFAAIVTLAVGCGGGISSPADPLFRQGDKYLAEQSYKAAIETFQSIHVTSILVLLTPPMPKRGLLYAIALGQTA